MELTDLHCCLALNRLPGIGSVGLTQWLERAGKLENLFNASAHELVNYGVPAKTIELLRNINWEIIQADLTWLKAANDHHVVTLFDANYPALLKQIPSAPMVLFVQGDINLLTTAQLAVVGSRNPSPSGKENAFEFARFLTEAGLAITSGLALGIDAASHRGALAAKGKTIAVLGTGLDRMYPAQHKALAHDIVNNGGALVSEFPIGSIAKPDHFPRRNRIISGLSLGTLVVEAALQSGSLITAKFALEQGREVFAIPGSIHNPLAKGCHRLIREGAKLVETGQDVLEELGALNGVVRKQTVEISTDNLTSDYTSLLKLIDYSPISVDGLVARSGLKSSEIASMLLILELQGYIVSGNSGYCLTGT